MAAKDQKNKDKENMKKKKMKGKSDMSAKKKLPFGGKDK